MMTTAQRIKQLMYPMITAISRWTGKNGKVALAPKGKVPSQPFFIFTGYTNQGKPIEMASLQGRYLLIANTASDCGYTAQYAELQQLQDRFAHQLTVLAFPSNDFAGQEPGTDDEIEQFCAINFGVKFPIMMKSSVKGSDKNEIFTWLTNPAANGWNKQEPRWNFCKYLVGKEGQLIGYFESGVSPLDSRITDRIQ